MVNATADDIIRGCGRLSCHSLFRALAVALVTFLFEVSGQGEERLWMEATINGKPARLAFDTGASHLILFARGAAQLGLSFTNAPKDARVDPGQVPMGTTEECDLQIADGIVRTRFGVVEIPATVRTTVDGVVGWQPLRENIMSVDACKGTVTFLNKIPKEATKWKKFKLQTHSMILRFEIPSRNRDPSVIVVDTGSEGGVELSLAQWQEWKAAHSNQPTTLNAHYTPHTGLVVAEEGWAKKLVFGDLQITEVSVREANKLNAAFGFTDRESLFGLAALKRVDLIIDGKRGFAYLHPKDSPPLPYEHNRLGAVFVPRDLESDDLIAHVLNGSPAWEAGIRSGDVLTSIEELDVTKWRTDPSVLPLSRFWERPPGTKFELALKRGDKALKTDVVLRQILSPEISPQIKLPDKTGRDGPR